VKNTNESSVAASGTHLIDDVEAARRLHRSPATLATWRCRGRGPRFVKLGGGVLYRPEDIEAFISANVRDPSAA